MLVNSFRHTMFFRIIILYSKMFPTSIQFFFCTSAPTDFLVLDYTYQNKFSGVKSRHNNADIRRKTKNSILFCRRT